MFNPTQMRPRRGGVLVIMAIVMFVIIGFVGLAIDWGFMTWTAQKVQVTADAAALAGAQQVWWSKVDARDAALAMANKNEAGGSMFLLDRNDDNLEDGDVVIGHYDEETGTFTPTLKRTETNAVKVVARRTSTSRGGSLPLLFGPIFDHDTAEVDRYAIAFAIGGPAENSVIALNEHDDKAFYIWGNGYMDLGDGAAQVDSDDNQGAVFQGTSLTFLAGQVNMVGSWDEKGNPDLNAVDMNPNEDYVADPLAGLPVPDIGSPMTPQIIDPPNGGKTIYWPGYYPKGLSLNNDDWAYLMPGVYILENGSNNKTKPAFDIRGAAKLEAYGVMFYIKFGNVEVNGTGDVHMTAPDEIDDPNTQKNEAIYNDIQFFQARDNLQEAHFNGTGLTTGTAADIHSGAGTFYFPSATVKLNGTGDMYIRSVISDKIEVGGDGRKYITHGYDGRKGGDAVYLVK